MTNVPGLGSLTLPEFSFATINASLPGAIALKLPSANFRAFNLQRLDMQLPGAQFLAAFRLPNATFSIGGLLKVGSFDFGQIPLPDEPQLSIRLLLRALFPSLNLTTLALPLNFPNPLDIALRHFHYDPTLKIMNLTVGMPGQINLIPFKPNFFKLQNIQAEIILNTSLPTPTVDFEAMGLSFLGTLGLNVRISKKLGLFAFEGFPTVKDISISQIETALGEVIMPSVSSPLGSFLHSVGLLDFTISDVKLTAQFGTNISLIFMGRPSFGAWPNVSVEFMIFDAFTVNATVAIGLSIPSVSLPSLIKTFFPGVDISGVPVLGSVVIPKCHLLIINDTLRAPTLNLPFNSPRLRILAGLIRPHVLLSGLIPMTFPNVGTVDLYAAFGKFMIEFTVRRKRNLIFELIESSLPPCFV